MKKIFTLLAASLLSLGGMATDYTDSLTVDINGVEATMPATISLTQNGNGSYNFSLKNFMFDMGGMKMGIGTIALDSVAGTTADGLTLISVDRNINITNGDDPSVSEWLGPQLGTVPVRMTAEVRGEKLHAVINIDMMAMLGQVIKVTFGNGGYQIPNSGFEEYHTYSGNIDEALHWHSFASAKGSLVGAVNRTAHTFQSADTRPGSAGTKSLSVKSTSVLRIVANGTITTGRMNAGSMQAANTANHAEMDMSSTEKDGNGDPFYVEMNGRPDSLAVWVKFSQGSANSSHPYATVSAYITDGTYFQDPQDKTYNNILASAKNATIGTTGGQWKRLSIPFDYVNDAINGRAILATISTNADPGQGSGNDEIIVDDLSLIYNAPAVKSLSFKGAPVEGFRADSTYYEIVTDDLSATAADFAVTTEGAKGARSFVVDEGNNTWAITVASSDLSAKSVYTVKLTEPAPTAKTYQDSLYVFVEGVTTRDTASVTIEQQGEGFYKVALRNFVFSLGEMTMPVGDIIIDSVAAQPSDDNTVLLSADKMIKITEGSDPNAGWIGPALGDVPVSLSGTMTDSKLRVKIAINMEGMERPIVVTFGYYDPATGISHVTSQGAKAEVFTIDGRRTNAMQPGHVYVVKKDGKSVKTLK